MRRLLSLAVLLVGCASSPEKRAAEQALLVRCAAIEVLPLGVNPARPYRVLGPVGAGGEGGPGERDRALRDRACALGADAVMILSEPPFGSATDPMGGGTAGARPAPPQETSGLAIAYTEGSPSVTPPEASAADPAPGAPPADAPAR